MESELRADSNLLQRVIAAIRDESKAVTIAQISMVISAIFSVLCVLAIAAAFNANAKVDYELPKMQDEIDQTRIRNDLYSIYMQELYVELKNQGFDPPPLPENE